jgi:hypothetical protein
VIEPLEKVAEGEEALIEGAHNFGVREGGLGGCFAAESQYNYEKGMGKQSTWAPAARVVRALPLI